MKYISVYICSWLQRRKSVFLSGQSDVTVQILQRYIYLMKDYSLWTLESSCCSKITSFRLIFFLHKSQEKPVPGMFCSSISTWPEEGTLNIFALPRRQMQKHSDTQCRTVLPPLPTQAGILVSAKTQNPDCTTGLCSETSGQINHSLLANCDFSRFPPFNSVLLRAKLRAMDNS